jgi:hypothetical protein
MMSVNAAASPAFTTRHAAPMAKARPILSVTGAISARRSALNSPMAQTFVSACRSRSTNRHEKTFSGTGSWR